MKKEIPADYEHFLETRHQPMLEGKGQHLLTWRGFWTGCFLSFFLAIGAPYGNMIIDGSYMSLDFSTPGAIFLFLFLIGILNTMFKLVGKRRQYALLFTAVIAAGWIYNYHSLAQLDPYSPGLIFSTFLLISSIINVPVVWAGGSLALNRAELILVYVMLLIVSALCSMGLSEQILPILTAIFYYASPLNKWEEKLFPYLPYHQILVRDSTDNTLFYEGLADPAQEIPYGSWVEPLIWWGVFLLALYVAMVSIAVILRRQWMERERLSYPIIQVGVAMIRGEEGEKLVNGFFKQPAMWMGCALPMIFGSSLGLHSYFPAFPVFGTIWRFPFFGSQIIQLSISWAIVGFSYLINANIAAGIWFFHLFSKFEKEFFLIAGLEADQKITYGVADYPFLAYQGVGALIAMVLLGLWVGRQHYRNVWFKAIGKAPEIDDRDEIMSYRAAVAGSLGGILVMTGWLWLMGTPWWIALIFIIVSLLIFMGVTRIVVEGGLAVVRAPLIAPDLIVQGLGSSLVGASGVVNLSFAFMWASDIRVFVMATCANGLKLIEEMAPQSRRLVFWGIIFALFIGSLGSFWMIFHMAYQHGGINLNGWFFKGAPIVAYNAALRSIEPSEVYWPGFGFFFGGGAAMLLMMWARQRIPWWPFHPIGFPVAANSMMNFVWFSVFLAWMVKRLVLRFGGASMYRKSQSFFLGLIAGQFLCNGMWLVIDYFTGKVGNSIFWI